MLSISIIIPVYNEAHHIKKCLDAIARQTIMPDEVLVVDNNCTDQTVAIARQYEFVTVLHESKQGLIAARNTGFAAATSDILGRIDADSQLDPDWIERVLATFTANEDIAAVTGVGRTASLPYISWPATTVISTIYYWYIQASIGVQVLWGANMAMRTDAWTHIQSLTSTNDQAVHEDQDISILLLANGYRLVLDRHLLISTTSGDSYRYLPKLLYYRGLHAKTKQLHKQNGNLAKAQQYRVSRMQVAGKILVSIPLVIYVWLGSIVLFPVDYIMRRIMRGKNSTNATAIPKG